MTSDTFVSADAIRTLFSRSMSEMYREEVPQYGTLLSIVADINAQYLKAHPEFKAAMIATNELGRLDEERHGAIRLGKASELATMRRIFAVMGMYPVGYYDLSVAGVPVHSTAFRPITETSLQNNPFRVFTSLLRLELIEDAQLRAEAEAILAQRDIFSPDIYQLLDVFERQGGLTAEQARQFVQSVKLVFQWHQAATVTQSTYARLLSAHRLIADVVCFKGPHINHLTPRTLDIDAAQAEMPRRGMNPKDVIEGPPARMHPILLRQTSFKALEEPIVFTDDNQCGTHTARFGEIEQRGMALTPKGRALYDKMLDQVRSLQNAGSADANYAARLAEVFTAFPDDLDQIRAEELAYFRYAVKDPAMLAAQSNHTTSLDALVRSGALTATPIIYEDFLPVSAAGIFQSNLGGVEQKSYAANASKAQFEFALGAQVEDELALYAAAQQRSIDAIFAVNNKG
jgi:uncharacterized glyoxalase superfamily metalloenzyme YdcJ